MEVKDLPSGCFIYIEATKKVAYVRKGETGYNELSPTIFMQFPMEDGETHEEWVRRINEEHEIDEHTEHEMAIRSMTGRWI